jgi:hypothetical protein
MANEAEINEVKAFLAKHDGEWESPDEYRDELPEVSKRLADESEPIAYRINEVAAEADLPGGVEEHGSGDWLILADGVAG